ncbi:L-glutamate gamma-semialdehyde dehydrogenase [candidate division TA06 bacterium]|nr:L-glutamate gamma-semialdehyde dehydrogenase [candidate division TA06 bacterium]
MNNAVFNTALPGNEPIYGYLKGSPERRALEKELERQSSIIVDIPAIINGREVRTGKTKNVVMPCDHGHVLAKYHQVGPEEVKQAIKAACDAKEEWMTMSWVERTAITLKAAKLIADKHRYLINASTMLGQGKNVFQAEIDSVGETIDFLRFNAYFISKIYGEQPLSTPEQMNRVEFRPLEGFVFTITPFNFTAIGSNLNMAPVLMGNTTIWKPATTSLLSNYYLMQVFKEAGLPDGVINFLPGSGAVISEVAMKSKELAGIHFTGSNNTFNSLWKGVSDNLGTYKSYPKLVGETGGKDFIFVHNSSDPAQVAAAFVRGAFEYQGQKCSACSRGYVPKSLWPEVKDRMQGMLKRIKLGDVRDFDCFVNAVIDERSFDSIMGYISKAKSSPIAKIIAGGEGDKSKGYFVQPTVIEAFVPHFVTMEEEIFGPVLTIYVYEDDQFEETLKICDSTSPYALTGAIFARERSAIVTACQALRYAAGNFYYNDKCSGAMVGLQPFGGARASGTNDKAGGVYNLLRWISPRTIKENYLPPVDFPYPYMEK